MQTPRVTKLRVLGLYVIEVALSDGTRRTVDLGSELSEGVFAPLKDPALFARAFIDGVGIGWPNDASLSPEFLYSDAKTLACQ